LYIEYAGYILLKANGAEPFDWGDDDLAAPGEVRDRYIAALRAADYHVHAQWATPDSADTSDRWQDVNGAVKWQTREGSSVPSSGVKRLGSANRTAEHALAAPIARHRAHRAPIRHCCSVALAQDAGDGRIDFPISLFSYFFWRRRSPV
jgi:hypothetical protein